MVESSAPIAAFVAEAQRTVMPDFRWDPVPRMGQQRRFARWVLKELATLDRGIFA